MKRISSQATTFHKRIVPVLAFGILGLLIWGSADTVLDGGHITPLLVVVPLLLTTLVYVVMRKFAWDLADEVLDGGNALVVRKGKVEERIPLSDIADVSSKWFMDPPRLTLKLKTAGRLGEEIIFIPKARVPVVGGMSVAAELTARTAASRKG